MNPNIPFDLFDRLASLYPQIGLTITQGNSSLVNWTVPERGSLTLRYRSCSCCGEAALWKNERAERKILGHLLESVALLGMTAVLETGNSSTPARAKLIKPTGDPTNQTGFHDGTGPLALETALITALLEAAPALQ